MADKDAVPGSGGDLGQCTWTVKGHRLTGWLGEPPSGSATCPTPCFRVRAVIHPLRRGVGWSLLPGHSLTWCPPTWVPSHLTLNFNRLCHGHHAFLLKLGILPAKVGGCLLLILPESSTAQHGCQVPANGTAPVQLRACPELRRLLGMLLAV